MAPVRSATTALLLCSAAQATQLPGCHRALQDISAAGHTDMQLAAYCRSSLPPQFCREANEALGAQPWPQERIAAACDKWGLAWNAVREASPERSAMDWASYQQTLQQCMDAKAEAGLCKDTHTGKPMPLNDCIDYKQQVYPEKTQMMHDAMVSFYTVAMGTVVPATAAPAVATTAAPTEATAAPETTVPETTVPETTAEPEMLPEGEPLPEGKFEQLAPLGVARSIRLGLPLGLGCVAGLGAAVMVLKRIRQRRHADDGRTVAFVEAAAEVEEAGEE